MLHAYTTRVPRSHANINTHKHYVYVVKQIYTHSGVYHTQDFHFNVLAITPPPMKSNHGGGTLHARMRAYTVLPQASFFADTQGRTSPACCPTPPDMCHIAKKQGTQNKEHGVIGRTHDQSVREKSGDGFDGGVRCFLFFSFRIWSRKNHPQFS